MIVSASRRTDIPAFYTEWLMNRLREKSVLVPHPKVENRYTRVSLDSKVVDCIVFWTKNPAPLLPYLKEIDEMGHKYYFQFTFNPYPEQLETNLPSKWEIAETFQELSEIVGSEKIVWRYDPIVLSDQFPISYHLKNFEKIAYLLKGKVAKGVFSFLDIYDRVRENMKGAEPHLIDYESRWILTKEFQRISEKYEIPLYTCSDEYDWSDLGIEHGACIDKEMVEKVSGKKLKKIKKDSGQRTACHCVESIDIGMYNSCPHGCLYCYANTSLEIAELNYGEEHDLKSPMLLGVPRETDQIATKEVESNEDRQIKLF